MSGASLRKELVTGLSLHSLDNTDLKDVIKEYHDLLSSCHGPYNSVLINNSVGRETITSSSSSLLPQMQFSHPCLKYINALIEAQNKNYGLYGTYIGLLCSGVLTKCIDVLNDGVSQRCLSDVTEWISDRLLQYIESAPCEIVWKVDIGNLSSLISFIRTIIFSKNSYCMSEEEKSNLSLTIANAFLKTVPDDGHFSSFGKVHVKSVRISSTMETQVYNGVLYPDPGFYNIKLMNEVLCIPKQHRTILFNIPLEYKTDKIETMLWDGQDNCDAVFTQELVKKLRKVLTDNNITILLSQKVINSHIKYELEKNGIIVLERLGTYLTKSVSRISGCECISHINMLDELDESYIGCLTTVDLVHIGDVDYLLLSNNSSNDVTITIPEKDVHLEEYLKISIDSCFASLRLLVQDARVTAGGGCFEAHIAFYLSGVLLDESKAVAEQLDVSANLIHNIIKVFKQVYLSVASHLLPQSLSVEDKLVDVSYGHLWTRNASNDKITTKCCCNLLKYSTELQHMWQDFNTLRASCCIDSSKIEYRSIDRSDLDIKMKNDLYCAKLNATRLALEGLSQILKIGYFVFDFD